MKIFIIPMPFIGHLNPLFAILKELMKNDDMQIIVYSIKKFQKVLEEYKIEFRQLERDNIEDYTVDKPIKKLSSMNMVLTCTKRQMKLFDATAVQLASDILNECPDLVIYDDFALFAKMTLRLITENKNNLTVLSKLLNMKLTEINRMPKVIAYVTTIPILKNIYPDEDQLKLLFPVDFKEKLAIAFRSVLIAYKAHKLSSKYRIKFKKPFEEITQFDPKYPLLVYSIPELQPKYEFFDKQMVKFVGSCIADNIQRLNGDTFDSLNENRFEKSIVDNMASGKRVVYVSLGTIFNSNIDIFRILIDAFNSDELQSENLDVIIATGKVVLEALEALIEQKSLKVSDNIKLVTFAPQIIVLKYAKLFITHSGFNSTKEAIHFGVPMICLPISVDQPLVANRVCSDLKLGIKLDFNVINANDIIKTIRTILNDKGYYKRCAEFSEISKRYDGPKNFANEIYAIFNKE